MRYIPGSVVVPGNSIAQRLIPGINPKYSYNLINIKRTKEKKNDKEIIKHEYILREKADAIVLKDPRTLHVISFTVESYEQGDAMIDRILNVQRPVDSNNPEAVEQSRIVNRARTNNIASGVLGKRRLS